VHYIVIDCEVLYPVVTCLVDTNYMVDVIGVQPLPQVAPCPGASDVEEVCGWSFDPVPWPESPEVTPVKNVRAPIYGPSKRKGGRRRVKFVQVHVIGPGVRITPTVVAFGPGYSSDNSGDGPQFVCHGKQRFYMVIWLLVLFLTSATATNQTHTLASHTIDGRPQQAIRHPPLQGFEGTCEMVSIISANLIVFTLLGVLTGSFKLIQLWFPISGFRSAIVSAFHSFLGMSLLIWYTILRPGRHVGLQIADARKVQRAFVRFCLLVIEMIIVSCIVLVLWTAISYLWAFLVTSIRTYYEVRVVSKLLCTHYSHSMFGPAYSSDNAGDGPPKGIGGGGQRRNNLNRRGTGGKSKLKGPPLPPLPSDTPVSSGDVLVSPVDSDVVIQPAEPDVYTPEIGKARIYATATDTYLASTVNMARHRAICQLALLSSFLHALVTFIFKLRTSRLYLPISLVCKILHFFFSGINLVMNEFWSACLAVLSFPVAMYVLVLYLISRALGVIVQHDRRVNYFAPHSSDPYRHATYEQTIQKLQYKVYNHRHQASAFHQNVYQPFWHAVVHVPRLILSQSLNILIDALQFLGRFGQVGDIGDEGLEDDLHREIDQYRTEIAELLRTFTLSYQEAVVGCVLTAEAEHNVKTRETWEYIYDGDGIVEDSGQINLVALNGFIMAAECEYDKLLYKKFAEQHFGATSNLQTYKTLMWTAARHCTDQEYLDKFMVSTCIKFMNDNQFKIYQGIHAVGKKELILSI